jgi:hypothetical protein
MLNRREWLRYSLSGAAAALATGALPRALLASKPADITVYKSPTCGCCQAWVKHMEKNGFTVATHDVNDVTEIKTSLGVPKALQSCHTTLYGKYVIEGHVPADLVRKVGKEQPKILGLAVPGMPSGSPGMESFVKDSYEVIAFERGGKTSVYAKR